MAACEASSLYVERAAEGVNEADGPLFQQPASASQQRRASLPMSWLAAVNPGVPSGSVTGTRSV